MLSTIKSEYIKMKHTFGSVIAIVGPIATILITLLLTGGLEKALPAGAWNWWYIMILPGMLSILCYLNIRKDGKLKFQNILLLTVGLEKSWGGKIIYCALNLFVSNGILFLGALIGGIVFGSTISAVGGFFGAILLSISYLWQIPLSMFLSAQFGLFANVFSSMVLAVIGVAGLADNNLWWISPSSIPARLMCPVLGIQPNGLPIPSGSELFSTHVIAPGIVLSLVWLLMLTYITARWFERVEVK